MYIARCAALLPLRANGCAHVESNGCTAPYTAEGFLCGSNRVADGNSGSGSCRPASINRVRKQAAKEPRHIRARTRQQHDRGDTGWEQGYIILDRPDSDLLDTVRANFKRKLALDGGQHTESERRKVTQRA